MEAKEKTRYESRIYLSFNITTRLRDTTDNVQYRWLTFENNNGQYLLITVDRTDSYTMVYTDKEIVIDNIVRRLVYCFLSTT